MQWNHLPEGTNKVEMYSILYIGLMDFRTNWMKLAQCLKRLKQTESLWLIISIHLVSKKCICYHCYSEKSTSARRRNESWVQSGCTWGAKAVISFRQKENCSAMPHSERLFSLQRKASNLSVLQLRELSRGSRLSTLRVPLKLSWVEKWSQFWFSKARPNRAPSPVKYVSVTQVLCKNATCSCSGRSE